jgi:hypothetical protein
MRRIGLFVAVLVSVIAAPAPAEPYGVDTNGTRLVTVDPANGAVHAVFSLGYVVDGIGLNPVDGTLWGVTDPSDAVHPSYLLQINPMTHVVTPVGPLGATIAQLTFAGDGTLYGWGPGLYTIDRSTGTASPKGGGSVFAGSQTFAVDPEGVLRGLLDGDAGSLTEINASTGATSNAVALNGYNLGLNASFWAATYACAPATLFGVDTDGAGTIHRLVTIDTATGEVVNVGATGDVWALANACPANIAMHAAHAIVNEHAGSVVIRVDRSIGTLGPAQVDYATASGTATSGADFTSTHGTIHFATGQASADITVPIHNDTSVEGTESFTMTLSNAAAGTSATLLGAITTVTIRDDDHAPKLFYTLPAQVRSKAVRNGLQVKFHCDEACTVKASLTRTVHGHVKTLARGTGHAQAVVRGYLTFRLTKAGKKLLAHLGRHAVRLGVAFAATDPAGHRSTYAGSIKLKL